MHDGLYPIAVLPEIREIYKVNITRGEIDLATKRLNRNKSPGNDYKITAEVLKDGGEFTHHLSTSLQPAECTKTMDYKPDCANT